MLQMILNKQTHRLRKWIYGYEGWNAEGRIDKEFGIDMHTLLYLKQIISKFSSVTQSCLTLCNPMDCSTPGFPVHHQLPELAQTQVNLVSDAIQPPHPLSSPAPPAFNLSQHQGLFQWVLCIRWPKDWSLSFSISPSSEYSGLTSFRIDWFDLLARTYCKIIIHYIELLHTSSILESFKHEFTHRPYTYKS